jgi:SRSO17 transposase
MAITVSEAGRRGGLSVLTRYGRGYFVQLGRRGQLAMRKRHPHMAKAWGKRGGRPKKPRLEEMGQEGK